LTVSGLAITKHRREFTVLAAKVVPAAQSPSSMATLQPFAAPLDTQDSQTATGTVPPAPAATPQSPVVITVKHGQTLGGVSLHYLGEFSPQVTREIQNSNPEITDPDLIIEGTQIRLPSPPVHADSQTSSSGEVPNRSEDRQ
jgi:hypothetical protein